MSALQNQDKRSLIFKCKHTKSFMDCKECFTMYTNWISQETHKRVIRINKFSTLTLALYNIM